MVQLKIVIDKRRIKSDGSYPIVYRITDVKKVTYISSGISVNENIWDEQNRNINKNHPNAQELNTKLIKDYYEIQKHILSLTGENNFSFTNLKAALIPADKTETKREVTFLEYADKLIANLIEVKRTGNAIVYQTAVNRLIKFCGSNSLKFTEIDYTLLDSLKQTLLIEGIKINSIGNYFRTYRAIFNQAIKAKIVDRSFYPFSDIKIKTEKTAKRAINGNIITEIEELNLNFESPEWHSRNYFLLSFYLRGVSFTDLAYFKRSNIINGRYEFKRRKTHKLYSIKIFPKAEQILKYYSTTTPNYLLPVLSMEIEDSLNAKKVIYQWIKTTNKYLKRLGLKLGLKDPLTTYVARHTFGTIAKRLGYSNEMIAEALGHEYGNKITNIYLDDFETEIIDEMHLRVITKKYTKSANIK